MTQIKKVRYTHEAMIDTILAEPAISQNALADRFDLSVSWISHVIASDAFQARLSERKEELIDPVLRATIEERFRMLVKKSLDVLLEKLAKPNPPDNLALRAAELGARSLGLGRAPDPPPAPSGDRLTILAERLMILNSPLRRENDLEGTATRINPGGSEALLQSKPVVGEAPGATVPPDAAVSNLPEEADGRSRLER